MTELEEVAQAIYDKHSCLWPLTRKKAEALAWIELPKDESEHVINGVADALMKFNQK